MPDFNQRIDELERKLAALKIQHAAGQITTDTYVAQAGSLRFTDDADGRTWWLDPNLELWYVADVGAPGFDLAVPQPGKRAKSPPHRPVEEPVASSLPPAWEKPLREASLPPESPIEEPTAPLASRVRSFFSGRRLQFILIPLEIVVSCMAGLVALYLLSPQSFQLISEPVTPGAQPVPTFSPGPPLGTDTPTPTFTPAPTMTQSAQPSFGTSVPPPAPTFTPVPPTIAPTPTFTPTPLPATATPRATATPPAKAAAPSPAPFTGKLAYPFYTDASHNFAIEVIDLASKQVIFTRQKASQPALTSDGKQLAYRSWDPSHLGLFAVLLTGQNERYLSVHEESQRPQWGPDNRSVAFSFLKTEADHEIKTINFDDEGFPLVPPDPGGFAQTAAWTPDGRLVFHACRLNACGLAIAFTNGAGFSFLTDSPDDISPAVSPDGQQIAYTSRQGENWDVYLVGINGGQPARLTTQPGKDGIPVWSPDGAWIAYASEVNGKWAIWVMTSNGQDQQQLVPLPGSLEGKVEAFVDDVQRGWRMESISWAR